ncbi:unnamed protein product [Arctogadus glacialis]
MLIFFSIKPDIDCSNLGDPLRTPIPSLTAGDLEFLDEFPWVGNSLRCESPSLEQIDLTPSLWKDPPVAAIGGIPDDEAVHLQPADHPSGAPHSLQDPPSIVSPDPAVANLTPVSSEIVQESRTPQGLKGEGVVTL